jgi:hypothetical protein
LILPSLVLVLTVSCESGPTIEYRIERSKINAKDECINMEQTLREKTFKAYFIDDDGKPKWKVEANCEKPDGSNGTRVDRIENLN